MSNTNIEVFGGDILYRTGPGNNQGSSIGLEPYLMQVSPLQIDTSTTVTLFVSGNNFDSKTTFDLGANITINNVLVVDANNVEITITTNNNVGLYELKAFNGTAQNFNTPLYVEVKQLTVIIPGSGGVSRQGVSGGATVGVGSISFVNTSNWSQSGYFGTIPTNTDGHIEMRIPNASVGIFMVGLNQNNTSSSWQDLDYGIYFASGNLNIYQNGSYVTGVGAIANNDILKIQRTAGVVSYYKNNNLLYTSAINSTGSLLFDCSGYSNGSMDNIRMVY